MFYNSLQVFSSLLPGNQAVPVTNAAGSRTESGRTFAMMLSNSINAGNTGTSETMGLTGEMSDFQLSAMRVDESGGIIGAVDTDDLEEMVENGDLIKVAADLELTDPEKDGGQVILPAALYVVPSSGLSDDSAVTAMVVVDPEALEGVSPETVSSLFRTTGGQIAGAETAGEIRITAGDSSASAAGESAPENENTIHHPGMSVEDEPSPEPLLRVSMPERGEQSSHGQESSETVAPPAVSATSDKSVRHDASVNDIPASVQPQESGNAPEEMSSSDVTAASQSAAATDTAVTGEPFPKIIIRPDISAFADTVQPESDQVSLQELNRLLGKLVSEGESAEVVYVLSDSGENTAEILSNSAGEIQVSSQTSGISGGEEVRIDRTVHMMSKAGQNSMQSSDDGTLKIQGGELISDTDINFTNMEHPEPVKTMLNHSAAAVESAGEALNAHTTGNSKNSTASETQSIPLTGGTDNDLTPSVSVPETWKISSSRSDNTGLSDGEILSGESTSAGDVVSGEKLSRQAGLYTDAAPSAEDVTGESTGIHGEKTPEIEQTLLHVEHSSPDGTLSGMSDSEPAVTVQDNEMTTGTMYDAKAKNTGKNGHTVQAAVDASADKSETTGTGTVESAEADTIAGGKNVSVSDENTQKSEVPVEKDTGGSFGRTENGNDGVKTWNAQESDTQEVSTRLASEKVQESDIMVKAAGPSESTQISNATASSTDIANTVEESADQVSQGISDKTVSVESKTGSAVNSLHAAGEQLSKNATPDNPADAMPKETPHTKSSPSSEAGQSVQVNPEITSLKDTSQTQSPAAANSAPESGAVGASQFTEQATMNASNESAQDSEQTVNKSDGDPAIKPDAAKQQEQTSAAHAANAKNTEKTVHNSELHVQAAGKELSRETTLSTNDGTRADSVSGQTVSETGISDTALHGDGGGLSFGSDTTEQFANHFPMSDDVMPDTVTESTVETGGRSFAVLDPFETQQNTAASMKETGSFGNFIDTGSVDDEQLMQTIVRGAVIMTRNGSSRATIDLEPPSLGKMHLEIVTERSTVTGKITVDSTEVKELVQNNITELQEHLAQNGLKVESFDVQVGHNGGTDSWARSETFRKAIEYSNQLQNTGSASFDGSSVPMEPGTGVVRSMSPYARSIDVKI